MKLWTRWIAVALVALAALSLLAPASGQIAPPGGSRQQPTNQPQRTTDRARPPAPPEAEPPPVWLYYLVFAALVGATAFVSLLPSKRGHQD